MTLATPHPLLAFGKAQLNPPRAVAMAEKGGCVRRPELPQSRRSRDARRQTAKPKRLQDRAGPALPHVCAEAGDDGVRNRGQRPETRGPGAEVRADRTPKDRKGTKTTHAS